MIFSRKLDFSMDFIVLGFASGVPTFVRLDLVNGTEFILKSTHIHRKPKIICTNT